MKLSKIRKILNDPEAIPDEWPDTIVCQLCNTLEEIQAIIFHADPNESLENMKRINQILQELESE